MTSTTRASPPPVSPPPVSPPPVSPPPNARSFRAFYAGPYLAEHRHPANVGAHVLGTVLGVLFVGATLASAPPYLALLFPLVHAVPGLVGHRLFERNPEVGDVRVLRKDYSPLWFIAANHLLTFERMRAALRRLRRRS